VPACDRQTDRWTNGRMDTQRRHIPRLYSILSELWINSNQILHNDKDHKYFPLVIQTHIQQIQDGRWPLSRKINKLLYLDRQEIWHNDTYWPLRVLPAAKISIFTMWCYTRAVYAVVMSPSIRPSVTRCYCTKTAKHRIMQTMPYSPGIFLVRKISAKFQWVNHKRGHQREMG